MTAGTLTAQQIALAVGAEVEGDGAVAITGASAIDSASAGDITFAVDVRRAGLLAGCQASAVIVPTEAQTPPGLTVLRATDAEAAFAKTLALLAPAEDRPPVGLHASAVVHETARLGRDTALGAHAVVAAGATLGDRVTLCSHVCIGENSTIGDDTVLFPGVVVRHGCRIGRRCRIHPNAVIGSDGFGYYHRDGVHHKVPHIGTVEIGDDVEIGACACVDRAKMGATRIGDGAKIDNLVQIAHNVQVGKGALLAGLVGVAGSSKLGDYVVLGGHVGIRDNIRIGDGVQVAGFSAVGQDVQAGKVLSGIPAFGLRDHLRAHMVFTRLPEMRRQVKALQARLDALENRTKNDRP